MDKLKTDELNKVSGGITIGDPNIECHKGTEVDKYSVVVGKKYVANDPLNMCCPYVVGICTKSYEAPQGYGTTRRHHVLATEKGDEVDISGDSYRMYEYI